MKRILYLCTLVVIASCASAAKNALSELFRNKTSHVHAVSHQVLPQVTNSAGNCSREHLAQLSLKHNLGGKFKCKLEEQEWKCKTTATGYICNVVDNFKTAV